MDDDSAETAAGPVFLRLGDCFLCGIGAEKDARQALECYQAAERYLFDMVAAGENLYRGSLQKAMEGQTAARQVLRETVGKVTVRRGTLTSPFNIRSAEARGHYRQGNPALCEVPFIFSPCALVLCRLSFLISYLPRKGTLRHSDKETHFL